MDVKYSMAGLAGLLAAPARMAMLEALLEGGRRAAIDLAVTADGQPQTASHHIAKLVEAGLVICEKQGRHRFYRIMNAQVGDVVETLGELVPSDRKSERPPLTDLELARTCYDHLAGRLGTSLTEALVARKFLRPQGKDFVLTRAGKPFLADLGVDIDTARGQRRLFARRCLDWTERRHHLGGALGAALARRCFELGWVRRDHDDRTVGITAKGARAFATHFGLSELA